ncbi:MAG TPA: TerB family tellurite resistance protein, partial [Polyangiaceae bacterium]|nr:TerB family tellurite resistance protein [Polyangiaceae bacterium]
MPVLHELRGALWTKARRDIVRAMGEAEHEAIDNPLEERVGYATVVAMMAAADDDVCERERGHLDRLCEALALPESSTTQVLAAAEAADEARVQEAISVLRGSDLRFTLFTDCLLVAYADEQVVPEEEAQLSELADALDIDHRQQEALRRLAAAVSGGKQDEVEQVRDTLRQAR